MPSLIQKFWKNTWHISVICAKYSSINYNNYFQGKIYTRPLSGDEIKVKRALWDDGPGGSGDFLYDYEESTYSLTKATGLKALTTYLGTTMEETMAIGDSENDYSMINAAGLGVAMGNASDDLKAIADYITTSNEEDGVGEVIKKFIP